MSGRELFPGYRPPVSPHLGSVPRGSGRVCGGIPAGIVRALLHRRSFAYRPPRLRFKDGTRCLEKRFQNSLRAVSRDVSLCQAWHFSPHSAQVCTQTHPSSRLSERPEVQGEKICSAGTHTPCFAKCIVQYLQQTD